MDDKPGGGWRTLLQVDLCIAMLLLAVLIFITFLGVVMRYCVNSPLTWLEEVQLACFVWIVFPGACAVARNTGHIAIDAFVGLFPMVLRRATKLITHLVIIATIGFLGWNAWRHTTQMYTSNRMTNILEIPYWLIYGIVPISCLYLVLNSILVLAGVIDPKPVNFVKEEAENV